MEEEYQESDLVFSDYYYHSKSRSHSHFQDTSWSRNNELGKRNKKKKQKRNSCNKSPPLDIPKTANAIQFMDDLDIGDDDEHGEGYMLPPHMIVAQRMNNYYNVSRKMACSLYVEDEKGRILKGRNLCQVRNSILRLTGFIET